MKPHTLKSGEVYLLNGPATLSVSTGAVEVIATKLAAGKTLKVPHGKRVPIQALEDSDLSVDGGPDCFSKMEVGTVPSEWDQLALRIAKERKDGKLFLVMVLGEVDTGKTFFSTYLANRLMDSQKRIAILDCDSGQSDIGPPGTFGMLVLKEPTVFLGEEDPTHLFMIGAHSPGLHFLPAMCGLDYLVKKAQKEADVLIVDALGLVQGDTGRVFTKANMDIADPAMVVLMQRGTELEHLVKHLSPEKIVRFPVSKKATPTSPMERKTLREHVSTRYFKSARVLEVPFKQVFTDRGYFLTGTQINLEGTLYAERLSGWEGTLVVTSGTLMPEITKSWPNDLGRVTNFISGDERGMMIGLLTKDQECLAIGRLDGIDFLKNVFRIRTPYTGDVSLIKGVQFGSLKVNEKGEEAGFLEPGSL